MYICTTGSISIALLFKGCLSCRLYHGKGYTRNKSSFTLAWCVRHLPPLLTRPRNLTMIMRTLLCASGAFCSVLSYRFRFSADPRILHTRQYTTPHLTMAMSDALKKQKLAEFAKKLEDKDDWTKRNAALVDMQKLITDPEEPLKLTSREIIALRVALFQQLEDLRSTIVREGCGLVAKMVCMLYSL
jgi:hypothetical protein